MIPKSGNRFSEQIMPKKISADLKRKLLLPVCPCDRPPLPFTLF